MQAIERRVQQLDADAYDDGMHFVAVMHETTPLSPLPADRICTDPAAADEAVRASALLRRLAEADPAVAVGPLDRSRQDWLASARHEPLSRERFVDVDAWSGPPSTKPFGLGLFTSTGMWQRAIADGADSLFPEPHTPTRLALDAAARVREVAGAVDWCALVAEHPVRAATDDETTFPDWHAIGRRYDAVHLTLSAVAAIQGIAFDVEGLRVAPSYWDVESTLWLHWHFG